MEINCPSLQLVEVELSNVAKGDTIYISNKTDSVPYVVLDKDSQFVFIENTRSHFAAMYHVVKPVYKLL